MIVRMGVTVEGISIDESAHIVDSCLAKRKNNWHKSSIAIEVPDD